METGWFAVFSPADDALGWDTVNAPALYFALVYSGGGGGVKMARCGLALSKTGGLGDKLRLSRS